MEMAGKGEGEGRVRLGRRKGGKGKRGNLLCISFLGREHTRDLVKRKEKA